MRSLKEAGIALAKIVLGMVILIEVITAVVFLDYTSAIGRVYSDKVAAAYEGGYDNGRAQTYDVGYQEAYGEAYDRGYDKGYEIGLEAGSRERAPTRIRVKLRNPTYKEMRDFLTSDEIDSNSFIRGEYVCSDFAADLNHNAEVKGIRVAYVRIRSEKWGHAVVAFETVDRGLIFIEPQSDKEAKLVIGEPFPWRSIGAISPLTSFDPVTEIQIIW